MTTTNYKLTLVDTLLPASGSKFLLHVALALVATALLTLSAKIQVPFYPVPMTMQTYVVLVIAMAFGPKLATASLVLYLLEGAVGLPVFAGTPERGLGLAYMMGPTGGYLVGFALATLLVGYLATRGWDRNFVTSIAAMTAGTCVIFVSGFAWLATLIGAEQAWLLGVLPFMLGAVVKLALAAATLPLIWRLRNKQ